MESCRERVRAADEVLEEARTGIGHWEAHVEAERDADRGRHLRGERGRRSSRRPGCKGPADQKRYADAQRAYERVRDASCGKAEGADAKVAATLANCRERANAQGPVLAAAAERDG